MIMDEAEFDLERWYATLQREKVEVWYSAPTAIRMMMRAGKTPPGATISRRCASSPASASRSTPRPWSGARGLWQPFHDNWWQTETGGIMIANSLDMEVKPGSMGKPLPGIGGNRERARMAAPHRAPARSASWHCGRLAVDDARLPA
jgi:acetyl-CoA synthetase